MSVVTLKYMGTVALLTGRLSETKEIDKLELLELIDILDEQYDGFKKMFLDEINDGLGELKRLTYLRKPEEPTRVLLDLDYKVEDGDTIVFW